MDYRAIAGRTATRLTMINAGTHFYGDLSPDIYGDRGASRNRAYFSTVFMGTPPYQHTIVAGRLALPQADLFDRAPTDSGAMSIPIHQLIVDRCYSTAHREVRRIFRIENGKVTYSTVGRNIDEVPWSGLTTVAAEKFAREVVREVPKPNCTR